jgi:hypothetical protein
MPRTMSDEHKTALAQGRAQGRAVRAYLDTLAPTNGEAAGIAARLADLHHQVGDEQDVATRIALLEERLQLERRLLRASGPDRERVEADFVEVAADYGRRRGISYAAWREAGVPDEILERAGIRPG